MNYTTYVFDLDGTLLDTLDDLTSAVNATLTHFQHQTRSRNEVCAFVGNGIVKLLDRAFGYPVEQEIVAFFKAYYGSHSAEQTKPYAGVIPLLTRLKSAGKQCAIVSNKADFAVKSLAKEYFSGLIDVAIGENEEGGVRKKPAPDSVFLALEKLGANRETTVYVGDSDVDIKTAQNAGLDCICVSWGFRDKAFLKANGATVIVDTCEEIF